MEPKTNGIGLNAHNSVCCISAFIILPNSYEQEQTTAAMNGSGRYACTGTAPPSLSLHSAPLDSSTDLFCRNCCLTTMQLSFLVPLAYRGGSTPPPRNSEGPPKSCQTQPDCENCYKLLNLGRQHPKMFGKKAVKF